MTQEEFKRLPELLTRALVVACGVPASKIDFIRVTLSDAGQPVAFGMIGAVQLPGRHCKQPKKAKFKYRKTDVARICGYKTE